jgi:ribonuclease HI
MKASVSELKKWQEDISREILSRTQGHVPKDAIVTFTDGASRGNPGLAGAGILLFNAKGEKIKEDCQFLGVCTNNEAEYRALIFALTYAKDLTTGPLCCFLDSQLTVRQLNGEYALKSEKLTPFFHEVKNLMRYFSSVTFTHVPREHPQLQMADALANKGIDQANK